MDKITGCVMILTGFGLPVAGSAILIGMSSLMCVVSADRQVFCPPVAIFEAQGFAFLWAPSVLAMALLVRGWKLVCH